MKLKTAGSLPYGRQGANSAAFAQLTRFGEVVSNRTTSYNRITAPLQIIGDLPHTFGADPRTFRPRLLRFFGHQWSALGGSTQMLWNTLAHSQMIGSWAHGSTRTPNGFELFMHANLTAQLTSSQLSNPENFPSVGLPYAVPPSTVGPLRVITSATVTDSPIGTANVSVTWSGSDAFYTVLFAYVSRAGRVSFNPSPPCYLFSAGLHAPGVTSAAGAIPGIYASLSPGARIGQSLIFAWRAALASPTNGDPTFNGPWFALRHTRTA